MILFFDQSLACIQGLGPGPGRDVVKAEGFIWNWPGRCWRKAVNPADRAGWLSWFKTLASGQNPGLGPDRLRAEAIQQEASQMAAVAAVKPEDKREAFEAILEKTGPEIGLGSIAEYLGIPERTARGWYADGVRRGTRPPYNKVRNRALSIQDGQEETFSPDQVEAAIRQAEGV